MKESIDNKIESQEQKKRILKEEIFHNDSKTPESTIAYEYDEAERKIKEKKSGNRFASEREFLYDSQGRLQKETSMFKALSGRGEIHYEPRTFVQEYAYEGKNENPSLVSISHSGDVVQMIENSYDGQGRITERKKTSFIGLHEKTENFEYDEWGNLVRSFETTNREGSNPALDHERKFYYDKKNRLVSEERGIVGSDKPFGVVQTEYPKARVSISKNYYGTDPESRELIWIDEKEKDSEGNIIKTTFTNFENGKEVRHSKTRHKYTFQE